MDEKRAASRITPRIIPDRTQTQSRTQTWTRAQKSQTRSASATNPATDPNNEDGGSASVTKRRSSMSLAWVMNIVLDEAVRGWGWAGGGGALLLMLWCFDFVLRYVADLDPHTRTK